jgi:ribose transport system permease protein
MEIDTTTLQEKESNSVVNFLKSIPMIYFVMLLVFIVIGIVQPNFYATRPFFGFLKRAAPLIVVSIGQMFAIISGEFDLSVGSLITVCAAVAAKVIFDDPAKVWDAFLWIFVISFVVGLINGLVTTKLRVPSFVTTLGMMLILTGAISIYTRGAPQGGVTDNFRMYGRANLGDSVIPIALIISLVVITTAVLLMNFTTFGRRIYAVGGNPIAARLTGVRVDMTKTLAFVLCSLSAGLGSVLIVGFAGMSSLGIGSGYEFQSISAVVLGGVALTGGRGNVGMVVAGALTLQALFSLLNFLGLPLPIRLTVQGLIIIGAVALAAWRDFHRSE